MSDAIHLELREKQILILICDQLTDEQIAKELHLTPKTVRWYVARLRNRVGADNKVGLALFAVRIGLVHL